MEKNRNEVKYGALLSYFLIFANAIYSLLIAPFILGTIGESEYGVYKTIASLTASVSVLELGLGGTLQRYTAKFLAESKKQECYNFSAMGLIQAGVLSLAMLLVGIPLFLSIDPVYGATFTAVEMVRAKQLFIIQICYVAFHIFENVISGLISGYNRFVFTNGMKIFSLALKVILYLVVLPIVKNSLAIVSISLTLEFTIILMEYLYLRFALRHKIKLDHWDKKLFRESFGYTALLFIQSIIIQFNGNVDNVVIGAVIGTAAVALYSFAIQIYNIYEQCATSISSVLLPTVIHSLHEDDSVENMEKMVIHFGRVQWMVLGAALFGFLCLGKEFFDLWLGNRLGADVKDCWYLSVILMVPVTFPLIVNVCLAILKAKNLLKFRTVAMGYSLIFNILFTILGTKLTGDYYLAAIGTAISTMIGSIISLNIYYNKKLKIRMIRVYFKIFHRILPCLLVASAVCLLLNCWIGGSWLMLIIKGLAFVLVYGILLLVFGLEETERNSLLKRRRASL